MTNPDALTLAAVRATLVRDTLRAAGVEPWTPEEARQLADTSRRILAGETATSHGHRGHTDQLTRENCAPCVLRGYTLSEEDGAPNHCAWSRTYVQARRPIPADYVPAFLVELLGAPSPYTEALRRDLATFGVTFV